MSPGWPANGTDNITNDFDGIDILAQPSITAGGLGQTIVVYPGGGGATRIAKIGPDGATVPVLVSLAEIDVATNQVRVRWFVVYNRPVTCSVRRLDPDGAWRVFAHPQATDVTSSPSPTPPSKVVVAMPTN